MELPANNQYDILGTIKNHGLFNQEIPAVPYDKPSTWLMENLQKASEDFAATREKQRKESQERFKTMIELGDYEGAKRDFITGYLGDNFQQMTPEQEAQFRQNFEMSRRQQLAQKLETEVNLGTKFAAAPAATQVSLWPQVFPNMPMPTKTEIDAAGQPTTLSFEEAQKLLQGKTPDELKSLQQMGLISGLPQMGQSITVRVSKKPDTEAMTRMTQTAKTAPRVKPGELQAIAKPAIASMQEFEKGVSRNFYAAGSKELQAAQEAKAVLTQAIGAVNALSTNPYRTQEDVQAAVEDLNEASVRFSQTLAAVPRSDRFDKVQANTLASASTMLKGLIDGLSSDSRATQYVARLQSIYSGLTMRTMDPKQASAAVQEVISNIQRSGIPFNLQRIVQTATTQSNAVERQRHNQVMENVARTNVQIANGRLRNAMASTGIQGRLADNLIVYRNGNLAINQDKNARADQAFLALLKQRAITNGISLEKLNLLEKSIQGKDDGRMLNLYLQQMQAKLSERRLNMQRDVNLTPLPNDPLATDAAEQRAATLAERELKFDENFMGDLIGDGPIDEKMFNLILERGLQQYNNKSAPGAPAAQQKAADRAKANAAASGYEDVKLPPPIPPIPKGEVANPPGRTQVAGGAAATARTGARTVGERVTPQGGPRVKVRRSGY